MSIMGLRLCPQSKWMSQRRTDFSPVRMSSSTSEMAAPKLVYTSGSSSENRANCKLAFQQIAPQRMLTLKRVPSISHQS